MHWKSASGRELTLEAGDITRIAAGAIVNAANSALAGGGGVDGAIHRAGGPAIMRELDRIRIEIGGRCPPGSAVATGAGALAADWVFHAVGPVYRDGRQGEPELLASCYRTCLRLAEERRVESIAFPAISAGVYGYPMDQAARIALHQVMLHLERPDAGLRRATFVLYGEAALQVFAAELRKLGPAA